MDGLIQQFFRFLGASLINIPLMGLITWGLFQAFRVSLNRALAVVTSCLIVSAGFLFLALWIDNSFALDENEFFQQITIYLWLVIGLLFWRKPKPQPEAK